jgi:hypothetical protein
MTTDRWSVKLAAREPERFEPEAHIPVFHRWIQQKRLPLVLIDVADYAHVKDGPGVLLVSHEYNIYADEFDGRPGLTVQRKVRGGAGSTFELGSVEVAVNDRLRGSNDDEGWRATEPAVREAGRRLYGDGVAVERIPTDAGARLAVKLSGHGESADALLARLE